MLGNGKKYDEKLKSKAFMGLIMRIVVCGYVLYTVYMLAMGTASGKSSMPILCTVLFCGLFSLASLGFAVYSVKSFLKALKSAELDDMREPKEN